MPALTTTLLPNARQDFCDCALLAILRYRECHVLPPQEVIDGLRNRLTRSATPGSLYDWRDALDVVMWDAGYAIEWRSDEIYEVTRWTWLDVSRTSFSPLQQRH